MEKILLEKLAYLYYPKGINAVNEKSEYIISNEYQRLQDRILFFEKEQKNNLLKKTQERLQIIFDKQKFVDATLFNWQDRCFNYQYYSLVEDKIISTCINISFIIPYYFIKNLEVKIDLDTGKWLSQPKQSHLPQAQNKLIKAKEVIQENLEIHFFNSDYCNSVVEDISFQDIPSGNFTLYNAFFLNELNIRT